MTLKSLENTVNNKRFTNKTKNKEMQDPSTLT